MPTRNDTKKAAAKGLSVAQYRYEWIRRHPDFEKEFESLLFTNAVMAEELHEKQDEADPQASKFVAALAETTAVLDAYKATRWPHFFKSPTVTIPLYPDTTEEEWLTIYRRHKERSLFHQQRDRFFSATPQPHQKPKKRIHKDELAFRLQVFDSYQELKNFTQVGQRLGHTESNVRRAYDKVFFDIFGAPQP